jgi:hypothetical protein
MVDRRNLPHDVFRRHYQETYAQGGYPYEEYEGAYSYGYVLGQMWEQPDRDWLLARPEARRSWLARRERPWEEVEEAVEVGWLEAVKELEKN